jgi:predicted RecA/RadA family phage recombinase
MTIKKQQDGNVLTWTNGTGSAVTAGQLIKMSHMLGVALVDIANGSSGAVAVEGVFSGISKVSGAVFAVGEKLIWDISANTNAGAFDDSAASPATGDVTGGAIAWVAGTDGQTTCTIKLTPGNATIA